MAPRYSCSVGGSHLIFHVLTCGNQLRDRPYLIAPYFQSLLFDTYRAAPPPWLSTGGQLYATAAYRESIGLGSYDDELRAQARIARQSSTPLRQLESHDGSRGVGYEPTRALSFLAADWLVRHADERSLLEYFRLIPRGDPELPHHRPGAGSWRAAFEQAFGVSVEDFYERFEADREAAR